MRVAREFASLGADWFAVSNLEEALQLRQAGIETPVLVLGYTPADKAGTLSRENISQCVYSLEYARDLSRYRPGGGGRGEHPPEDRHRHEPPGFYYQDISRDEAAVEEVKEACSLPGLVPQGIFTHFAVSDEGQGGDAFTMRQFGCLKEMIESLARAGGDLPRAALRQLRRLCSTTPCPTWTWSGRGSCSTACTPPGAAQPACFKARPCVEVGGLSRKDPAAWCHGELRQEIHRPA